MKKIQVLMCGAAVAMGAFTVSCDNGASKSSLKTSNDTLSYSFGATVAEKELTQALYQMGVLGDTAMLDMEYQSRISQAADSAAKLNLQNELKTKKDSISKANAKNLASFLSGLKEGINAGEDKSAYMMGLSVGHSIGKNYVSGIEQQIFGKDSKEKLNKSLIYNAIADVLNEKEGALDDAPATFQKVMEEAQKVAQAKRDEELKKEHKPAIEAGEKFLAENRTKEGVVTTASGLQYKVVKQGTGAKPTANDVVKVHYKGTLLDGTVFDSSYERKEPVTFPVGGVIKGWTEVLQLMPVGSKYTVYIPYDLAYGSSGAGEKITPFSTLIFEVELLGIEKSGAAAQ